jgi:hypothetical protein
MYILKCIYLNVLSKCFKIKKKNTIKILTLTALLGQKSWCSQILKSKYLNIKFKPRLKLF